MFASQGQAKRFFVEKIVAQATREGRPLSENERWMLSFSESDPEFVVDATRVRALEAEIPDAEYERKVAGLADRACTTGRARPTSPRTRMPWPLTGKRSGFSGGVTTTSS